MKKFDLQSGFLLLTISILICIGSVRLSLGSLKTPGPGFMSFLAGALLGVFALTILAETLVKGSSENRRFWESSEGRTKVILTLVSLFIYGLGLHIAGFIIMTGVFIGFLLAFIGNEKWTTVVLGGILSAVVSYLFFGMWLGLQLPKGFLGI